MFKKWFPTIMCYIIGGLIIGSCGVLMFDGNTELIIVFASMVVLLSVAFIFFIIGTFRLLGYKDKEKEDDNNDD